MNFPEKVLLADHPEDSADPSSFLEATVLDLETDTEYRCSSRDAYAERLRQAYLKKGQKQSASRSPGILKREQNRRGKTGRCFWRLWVFALTKILLHSLSDQSRKTKGSNRSVLLEEVYRPGLRGV